MAQEGQTATGPNGQRAVFRGGRWVPLPPSPRGPVTILLPQTPRDARNEAREDERIRLAQESERRAREAQANAEARAREAELRAAGNDARTGGNQRLDNISKMRDQFDTLADVKNYRTVLPMVVSAMNAPNNGQGDLSTIYAFGKVMDPGSVVREGEMDMASQTASLPQELQQWVGRIQSGQRLAPEVRRNLVETMRRRAGDLNTAFLQQRARYTKLAQHAGFDPEDVVGLHPGAAFQQTEANFMGRPVRNANGLPGAVPSGAVPGGNGPSGNGPGAPVLPAQGAPSLIQQVVNQQQAPDLRSVATDATRTEHNVDVEAAIDAMIRNGATPDQINAMLAQRGDGRAVDPSQIAQAQAFLRTNPHYGGGFAQALREVRQNPLNRLAASPLGAGIAGALNGASAGLLDEEVGALRSLATGQPLAEAIFQTNQAKLAQAAAHPLESFVGNLVGGVGTMAAGGAFVPAALKTGGWLAPGTLATDIGYGALSGAGENNENRALGGTIGAGFGLGGSLAGRGLALSAGRRAAERAVPTVEELKQRAGDLYRQAEANGITAGPNATQALAQDMRGVLASEGHISPTGRLSDVHPKLKEAIQLADDYAGQSMTVPQMQTVRKIVAGGLDSKEPAERRAAGLLLGMFDDWAAPLAPELAQARDVARRYIEAGKLVAAREMAGKTATGWTGAGAENALRTQYRNLDKGLTNGTERFSDPVAKAINAVNVGTPMGNVARQIGRLAPHNILNAGVVANLGYAAGGLGTAGAIPAIGLAGRALATRATNRGADIAELLARNRGELQVVPLDNRDIGKEITAALMAGTGQYEASQQDTDVARAMLAMQAGR